MNRSLLSDNELAVLQILWSAKAPLSRPEILERMPENEWNPNSIHLVLNNLIKNGLVKVAGVTRCGQSYGRTYCATKTKGEYTAEVALNIIPDLPKQECIVEVMSAMVKETDIDEKTIDLLKQMLDERREELKEKGNASIQKG